MECEVFPIPASLILENHRKNFILFYEHVNRWAEYNRLALEAILSGSTSFYPPFELMIQLYNRWMESWITDYPTWGTMQSFGGVQSSPALHIFIELSRSRFICMYTDVSKETEYVRKEGQRPDEFSISYRLELTKFLSEDGGVPWDRPLMMFSQQDVFRTLLLLTKILDSLPLESTGELRRLVDILFTRNSVFFCEETSPEILNMELMRQEGKEFYRPSRDYLVFSCVYFHALYRRLYYLESIKQTELTLPKGVRKRTEEWIHEVINSFGSEGFEDCFNKAVEEAYNFPGDREWFRYRYPDMPAQTGPILDCFRKAESKAYFTQHRISRETLLNSVELNSHTGHCARLCILNIIDQYMRTRFSIPWRDGLVIPNSGIEGSQVELFQNRAPYLLQLYSRYWVYDEATIYPSDSIYESFAYWLILLEKRYSSQLFGSVDLSPLVKRIIHNERKKTFVPGF